MTLTRKLTQAVLSFIVILSMTLPLTQTRSASAQGDETPPVQADPQTQDPDPTETPLPIETPVLPENHPSRTPLGSTEIVGPGESTSDTLPDGAVAISSATWYVATTGSDSNSCSEPAAPCLTINNAVHKAAIGDTILVASGTYTGIGSTVAVIVKDMITISGGWNSGYTQQSGSTILDGQNLRKVMYISADATLDHLTIVNGNNPGNQGGGIELFAASVTIENSTIQSNKAQDGGGIYMSTSTLTLNNTTITGNEASSSGGGIATPYSGSGSSFGSITANNSTIAGNKAWAGGGLSGGAQKTLQNTILARNTALYLSDCRGGISLATNSIIQDPDCYVATGSYSREDPLLSPVLFGSPAYYSIDTGSPAIDAGDPATCTATDQRGQARTAGAACDIGAYEYSTNGPAVSLGYVSGSNQKTGPRLPFGTRLAAYAVDATGAPVSGVSVQFDASSTGASGAFADNGTYTTIVLTDGNGIATAPTFTANSESGTFQVTAAAGGLNNVTFTSLTNRALHVSSAGADSGECSLPGTPCLTMNYAIGKAISGDVIKVTGETYTGSGLQVVLINKNVSISGGWSSDFEIQNGYTTIDAQNVLGRRGISVNNAGAASQVTLDWLVVQNANSGNFGGGISVVSSNVTLKNSLLRDNRAAYGAGMNTSRSDLVLINTTISGNRADFQGGGLIFGDSVTDQTLIINNSTIAYNQATEGGGLFIEDANAYTGRYERVLNSIIANNTAPTGPDCRTSSGYDIDIASHNIIKDPAGCTVAADGYIKADPFIGASLSGMPGIHALQGHSPAIDAGDPVTCLSTDQLGVARPQGYACDIGAYELPTFAVTTLGDTDDGACDSDCSLREAITAVPGGSRLIFDLSGTLTLNSALPAIDKVLSIDGREQPVTVDGAGSYRIFEVTGTGDLTLNTLTLQNGNVTGPCPGETTESCGGAIYSDGQLTLVNSTLSGSSADLGGAVFLGGGSADITNSTFSANTATSGGGIYNDGSSLDLKSSTFSDNLALDGGGLYNVGTLHLTNSILANTTSGNDCYNEEGVGLISTNVGNLVETNADAPNNCGTPAVTGDPHLGDLADNGGPTQTQALLLPSLAIDRGDVTGCPGVDQRGTARPQRMTCDIGAFEYVPPAPATDLSSPKLLIPGNNQTTFDPMLSFNWSNVTNAVLYEIQFATNATFTENLSWYFVSDPGFAFSTATADGKYYWRVRAYNVADQPGSWSPPRAFTVLTLAPAPSLPANGASVRGVPIFRWKAVSGAIRYQFEIDNNNDFSSPLYSLTQRTTYRRLPGGLRGTYYWRIRVQDRNGNWTPWSATFTIHILAGR